MPIEIRELQIKATVAPTGGSDTAAEGDHLLRFGDPVPDATNGKGGAWDDAVSIDRTDPDAIDAPAGLFLRDGSDDAAATGTHSGGVNMTWGDGSVRVVDGFDLLS